MSLSYDIENRMVQASAVYGSAQTLYEYGTGNTRVYQSNWTWTYGSGSTLNSEAVYFHSVAGQKIGVFTLSVGPSSIWFIQQKTEVWFGAKLINGTVADRVASFGKYCPYGEGRPQGQYDTENFATYTRDSATGLDYAMNRYYNSVSGSFMTPDPYKNSAGPKDPGSWNRYKYARNDPVGARDPSGLCDVTIGGITQSSATALDIASYGYSDITVYPYSNGAAYGPLLGGFDGVLSVAAQALGANSSTCAAVQGILTAAPQGGPINVTSFSGGAAAFTAAVNWLNNNGESSVTSQIGNVIYVSPGNAGTLFSNANTIIL